MRGGGDASVGARAMAAGGRDRHQIVAYTHTAERDYMPNNIPPNVLLTDVWLAACRADDCAVLRGHHADVRIARAWPLRYRIRRTAFGTLDHVRETENTNLTSAQA